MFFITPGNSETGSSSSPPFDLVQRAHSNKRKRLSQDHNHDQNAIQDPDDILDFNRKRVARACDRCRMKKTKCSGGTVCQRCKQDRVVCVTTPTATKKGDIQQHPGYTHLVETQRDHLARALYQLLRTRDPAESNNIKQLLADMGITTESIRVPEQLQSTTDTDINDATDAAGGVNTDAHPVTSPSVSEFWDNMFNNLSGPQLEAIESLCTMTPRLESSSKDDSPFLSFDSGETEFDSGFWTDNLHEALPQPLQTGVPADNAPSGSSSDWQHTAVDPRSLTRSPGLDHA